MLNTDQKELLNLVMMYVNDAHKHKVDEIGIEQSLTYILKDIQELAMEVEDGKWEKESED